MAYVIGYVSEAEREELERRGWEVEDAHDYALVEPVEVKRRRSHHVLQEPPNGSVPVLIWVDTDVFKVMDGPDWEKG